MTDEQIQQTARATGQWAKQQIAKGADLEEVVQTLTLRLLDSQDQQDTRAADERIAQGQRNARERGVLYLLIGVLALLLANQTGAIDLPGIGKIHIGTTQESP